MIMRFLIVLAALAAPVAADVLLLEDGRIIEGPKMEQLEGYVEISFEAGKVQVKDSLVNTLIVEGQPDFVPETDEEKAQFEKGLVPYQGKWIKASKRSKLIEAQVADKLEAIEEAKAHSQWGNRYQKDTKNFAWQYTLPQHIAEGLQNRLEAYYKTFAKEWRIKRDKRKAKLTINFFGDAKEYSRTSGAPGGALAYFMFLGDYDLCVYYDRLDPVGTEMVLFHEASHYMQKLINESFKMPHWPGEGLAEYYGGASWDAKKKKLAVGLIQEGRLTEVQSDIAVDKYMSLVDVVTKDEYTDYTWGWTLVHFFMHTPKYTKGFKKFVTGLANAKGVKRSSGAFNLKFVSGEETLRYLKESLKIGDSDELKKVEDEWYAYIKEELNFTSASGLEKAANSARGSGKPIRAKRLYKEAFAAGEVSALGHHNYARMIRNSDKASAKSHWRKAIDADPLVGTFYFELGRLELAGGDEEEGKRLQALARELDPEVDSFSVDIDLSSE